MTITYLVNDNELDYEIDYKEAIKALKEITIKYVGADDRSDDTRKFLDFILKDLDIEEDLMNYFEEEVKKYFESDFYESIEGPTDIEYYGMHG